jgi:hypothetical protein
MTKQTDNRRPPPAGAAKTPARLRVVKLEGRIAPRIALNHNETVVREPAKPKKAARLRVVKLEGRIAPRIALNHNETLVRDRA